jgi:hypothetical protein
MSLPIWLDELLERNKNAFIEELNLNEWGIESNDLRELAEKVMQHNVKIKLLSLYRNNIDDEAIPYFIKIQDRVEEINLRQNNIADNGTIQLIKSNIKKFNFAENCLSDASVNVFIKEGLQIKINFAKNKRITADLFPKVQEKLKSNNQQQSNTSSTQAQKPTTSAAVSSYSFYNQGGPYPSGYSNNKVGINESLSEADKAALKVQLTELVTTFMREHNCTETALINDLPVIAKEVRPVPPPSSKATAK